MFPMIKIMNLKFEFEFLIPSKCSAYQLLKTSEFLLSYSLPFGCASGIHYSLMFSLGL